ncbi:hypothetical protein J437_LFUL000151 [Ladona fulva]|uniref:Uncharacterized protein n=1 Tax=Ladona fulva TaxID=123851 RepID=A0A8K0KC34_LADFU|nr:hypothetical protein J437_LFUL000151 [Ladona fulva]
MAEYGTVKVAKLNIKGFNSSSKKKKKRKRSDQTNEEGGGKDEDFSNHGDGPSPEEILTAVRVGDSKIALKSGYGKYIRVEAGTGKVVGRSDAIGALEQWEPVFQDGKMALLGSNEHFLGEDSSTGDVVAISKSVGPGEIVRVRSNVPRACDKAGTSKGEDDQDKGNIRQVEINYVKKFQKFQDKRLRLCEEETDNLEKARIEGSLHEALLDRRSKMKADRYCK